MHFTRNNVNFLIPKSRDLVPHNPGIEKRPGIQGSRDCNPYRGPMEARRGPLWLQCRPQPPEVKPCVGCEAQLVERRSLAGELTMFCARPAAEG